MSEQGNDPQTITMGDLRAMVEGMVAKATAVVTGGNSGGSGEQNPPAQKSGRESGLDVQAQVQAELSRLREMEERQKSEAELKETVRRLAERDAAGSGEKAPVERRRVHKLMGWGDND